MLAHVPSCGWNPRGSPDFLAYPFPRHVSGAFLVPGFRAAWVSHTLPRV